MGEQRDLLLARVLQYYAEHGIRDTSLRTLAAAIGTSQRMLHHHFGSRADVLRAVIDAVAGSQAEQIGALFAEADDPFVAGWQNWVATAEGAQTYGALWFELATHAMRGEPYASELGRVMVEAQLRELTTVFAARTDRARAERLARLTLAVGQGLLFQVLVDGEREAADAAVAELIDLVRRDLPP